MQRGIRLFNDVTIEQTEANNFRRGRSETFITNRNECLLYRFYYYSKIKRVQYELALEAVSIEFFLSPRTVSNIFQDNAELVKRIYKEEKLSIKQLEKKFNFLNWKLN